MPFRVKAHGSELEYSMRGRPELEAWGRESLAHAEATFVGSRHIREVLEDVVGHVERVFEVPPGVDVDEFVLQERDRGARRLVEEARNDPPNPGNAEERLPDEGNAERLAEFLPASEPTVVYFGKLIEQKGVQVLLEAMRGVDARLVVVGFGALSRRRWRRRRRRARSSPGRSSTATSSTCCRSRTPRSSPRSSPRRSAWSPRRRRPRARRRSSRATPGLAEVAAGLEASYPERFRHLASFESGNADELARKLNELLALSHRDRDELARAARRAVVERWSWTEVARRLLGPVG